MPSLSSKGLRQDHMPMPCRPASLLRARLPASALGSASTPACPSLAGQGAFSYRHGARMSIPGSPCSDFQPAGCYSTCLTLSCF